MFVDECHVTRVNQGLFSTTMEAEKRDPGNEVVLLVFCWIVIPLPLFTVVVRLSLIPFKRFVLRLPLMDRNQSPLG